MSGAYGERMGRAVHVERPPTLSVRLLKKADFAVTRLTCHARENGLSAPIPPENAFSLSLQLRDFLSYDLWVAGRPVRAHPLKRGSMALLDLNLEPIANLRDPFDSLHFYIPRSALDAFAEEHETKKVSGLHIAPGVSVDDAVVRHLGAALLPAIESPERVNRLFLDHVGLALHAHLAEAYGEMRLGKHGEASGGLSLWQERRVKELLVARINGDVSLEELARECKLSRSYFARAFKRTTGLPPHRWLLAYRIERARNLLLYSSMPIADITRNLGFADQSHFTRVFARAQGLTPGALRRLRRD
jgi:AraC family transcriptional regulator